MVHERVPAVRIHICCLLYCEVVGWKAANLWAWEEKQRKWRHKGQYSSITWCCISAESGWHVCNSTRSFPGMQRVKPPKQAGNTLLWRVLLPGREGVTQLLRGGQALLYIDHLNICVTLQNLQSASNLLTEHNMPQPTAIMDNWAPPNISANYMIPN